MQFLLLSLALTAAAAPLHKRAGTSTNTVDSTLSSVETELSGTIAQVDGSIKRRNGLDNSLAADPAQLVDGIETEVQGVDVVDTGVNGIQTRDDLVAEVNLGNTEAEADCLVDGVVDTVKRDDLVAELNLSDTEAEVDGLVDGVVVDGTVKRENSLVGDNPVFADTVFGVENTVNDAELDLDQTTQGVSLLAPVEGATADTISGVENGMNKELNTIDTQRRSNLLAGTEQAGQDVTGGLKHAVDEVDQELDVGNAVKRQVVAEVDGVVVGVEGEVEGVAGPETEGLGL